MTFEEQLKALGEDFIDAMESEKKMLYILMYMMQ